LHSRAVANDSSGTQFFLGVISFSVTVKSGVMNTQPSARKFAGVDNMSKKSTAIEVFTFMLGNPSASLEARDPFEHVLTSCSGLIAGEICAPIFLLAQQ